MESAQENDGRETVRRVSAAKARRIINEFFGAWDRPPGVVADLLEATMNNSYMTEHERYKMRSYAREFYRNLPHFVADNPYGAFAQKRIVKKALDFISLYKEGRTRAKILEG